MKVSIKSFVSLTFFPFFFYRTDVPSNVPVGWSLPTVVQQEHAVPDSRWEQRLRLRPGIIVAASANALQCKPRTIRRSTYIEESDGISAEHCRTESSAARWTCGLSENQRVPAEGRWRRRRLMGQRLAQCSSIENESRWNGESTESIHPSPVLTDLIFRFVTRSIREVRAASTTVTVCQARAECWLVDSIRKAALNASSTSRRSRNRKKRLKNLTMMLMMKMRRKLRKATMRRWRRSKRTGKEVL